VNLMTSNVDLQTLRPAWPLKKRLIWSERNDFPNMEVQVCVSID
jgi:hypothetical protein